MVEKKNLIFPQDRSVLIHHVLDSLDIYWPQNCNLVLALPICNIDSPKIFIKPEFVSVPIPHWAGNAAVDGYIMVPREACKDLDKINYKQIDWWLAAFLYLECWHERIWEHKNGTIHSYSFKLKEWDFNYLKHAWVNRIGMFFRAWVAHNEKKTADVLFGNFPTSTIHLSYDIDAISKTLPIRLKQGAFNAYNAIRSFSKLQLLAGFKFAEKAFSFLIKQEDLWGLDEIIKAETNLSKKGVFNCYAKKGTRSVREWFFDPHYYLENPEFLKFLEDTKDKDYSFGLHPGVDSWEDHHALKSEKSQLEKCIGRRVKTCRQHWLKFSWERTWSEQEKAELIEDHSLMFNDRPGFRCSAALKWQPWDQQANKTHSINIIPTILMDSHFYDYNQYSKEKE